MISLQRFIDREGIAASAQWADSNPNMDDMPAGSSHWRVTLRRKGRLLTVPFSMGPAYSREPNAKDVLNSLASDAAGYESARGFEDWAEEYGYGLDSRKAERTYRAVERQTERLRAFLDPEAYARLLWETESL